MRFLVNAAESPYFLFQLLSRSIMAAAFDEADGPIFLRSVPKTCTQRKIFSPAPSQCQKFRTRTNKLFHLKEIPVIFLGRLGNARREECETIRCTEIHVKMHLTGELKYILRPAAIDHVVDTNLVHM